MLIRVVGCGVDRKFVCVVDDRVVVRSWLPKSIYLKFLRKFWWLCDRVGDVSVVLGLVGGEGLRGLGVWVDVDRVECGLLLEGR